MGEIVHTEAMQWNRTLHTATLRDADTELADLVDSGQVDADAVNRVRERLQKVMADMKSADAER